MVRLNTTLGKFKEMVSKQALMLNALWANSFKGDFIWKVNNVARRVRDARDGKVQQLYTLRVKN